MKKPLSHGPTIQQKLNQKVHDKVYWIEKKEICVLYQDKNLYRNLILIEYAHECYN